MLFLGTLFHVKITRTGADFTIGIHNFASRILGAMTQSCYIGTRDIRSRVIRSPYCTVKMASLHWDSPQMTFVQAEFYKKLNVLFANNNVKILPCRSLSHCSHPNKEVLRSCMCHYGDATMFICSAKLCMSSSKTPVTWIYKYIKHNYKGVSLQHLVVMDSLRMCVSVHIDLNWM